MVAPKSTPTAPASKITTASTAAAAPTSTLRIRILWRTTSLLPRWRPGSTLSLDNLADDYILTRVWETPFPRRWRGLLGLTAADRGAASGRGPAVVVAARSN